MLLAALLMFNSIDLSVMTTYAKNITDTTNEEKSHTEHTPECGYVEAVEGHPCTHKHDDSCYAVKCIHEHDENCGYVEASEGTPCGHVHDAECGYTEAVEEVLCDCTDTDESGEIIHTAGCGYVEAVEGSPCTHIHDDTCGYAKATEGTSCNHICSVENGCYELVCSHAVEGQHDDTCGYVEAVEGSPCKYEYEEEDTKEESTETSAPAYTTEDVKAMLDALPSVLELEAMSEDELSSVYEQAQEASDAYEMLTEEQQTELSSEYAKLKEVLEYMAGLTAPANADTSAFAPERYDSYAQAGKCIFANGTAITIEAASGGTVVWYMDGNTKKYVNANGANGEDLSDFTIFAGSNNVDGMRGVNGSITMTGGTVGYIGAGQYYGTFSGTSNITITGGTVTDGILCNSMFSHSSGDKISTVTIFDAVGTTIVTGDGKADNVVQKKGDTWNVSGNGVIPSGVTLTVNAGETLNVPTGATLTNNGTLVNNGTMNLYGTVRGNDFSGSGTVNCSAAYIENAASVSSISAKINGSEYTLGADRYRLLNGTLYVWLPDGNAQVTLNGKNYYGVTAAGQQTPLTDSYVGMNAVSISGIPSEMNANSNMTLSATLTPSQTTTFTPEITYELVSSDTTAPGVTLNDHTLYAAGAGKVSVKVMVTDGYTTESKNFALTVNHIAVTDLVGEVPTTVIVNAKTTLPSKVTPDNASYQNITWQVVSGQSETGAAINNGMLTAAKTGTFTIRATVENGKAYGTAYTKDFTVKVVAIDSSSSLEISVGSVTISANADGTLKVEYSGYGGDGYKNFAAEDLIVITGETNNNRVIVKSGSPKVVLSDCSITSSTTNSPFEIQSGALVNLTLHGNNVLKNTSTSTGKNAGLYVPSGAEVVINGTGTLEASSSAAAGIGGALNGANAGSITINEGTIIATGNSSAGIGGGYGGSGGTISITGGTITATANWGAGIGGGRYGSGGAITISGGNVKASSQIAKAIGAGYQGAGGTLTDGNGNPVSKVTFTLDGLTGTTSLTKIEGSSYGMNGVSTLDTNKLYFYLPSGTKLTSITTENDTYICNQNNTFYKEHKYSAVCDETCDRCGNIRTEVSEHDYDEKGFCRYCGLGQQAAENNGIYEISNAGQLFWFAEHVNENTENASAGAKLMADIDVGEKMNVGIGTSSVKYAGVFDGNGHTLTIEWDSVKTYTAPFPYVNGATIKNLTVEGTIATDQQFAAGIVGSSEGTTTIENCLCDVTINSAVNGDGTHGGLVANVSSGTTTIKNCGFTGAINGSNTNNCGGFVGWSNGTTTISNSFIAATFGIKSNGGCTFARNPGKVSLTNCYYLDALGTAQGTQKSTEQFASGEVAWLLNGSSTEGVWKQTLKSDTHPVFTGGTVYFLNGKYTNTPHTHVWEYTGSNNGTITATCKGADGNCENPDGGSLTLQVEDACYTGNGIEATVTNKLTLAENVTYKVTYDEGETSAPKGLGKHTAILTVCENGTEKASVQKDYTISYLPAPETAYRISNGYKDSADTYWFKEGEGITVSAPYGYTIATSLEGSYGAEVTLSETDEKEIYLKNSNGEMTDKVEITETFSFDGNAPDGKMEIKERGSWQKLWKKISFGLFYKGDLTAAITASDAETGVKSVEYYLADSDLIADDSLSDAAAISKLETAVGTKWNTYSSEIPLSRNAKIVIYAKITDNVGNVTYINSAGLVLYADAEADTSEITTTYCANADKEVKVVLNGNTIKSVANGDTILTPDTDYTVNDNIITLKAAYLDTLNAGDYTFTVAYHPLGVEYAEAVGNEAPETTTFKLSIEKAEGAVTYIGDLGGRYNGKPVDNPYYESLSRGAATFEYKGMDEPDIAYSADAPKTPGEYTVRVTVAADDNYKEASATKDFKIRKGQYSDPNVTREYLYSRPNEDTIDLSSLLPRDCGDVLYEIDSKCISGAYTSDPKVDLDENLSCLSYTVSMGNVGETGTIVVKAKTDNYEDITITVSWELIDQYPVVLKEGTSVTLIDNVLTYGEPLSKLKFHDAVFVSENDPTQIITGTLAWTNPADTPNAGTTNAQWTFTPDDSDYATVPGNVGITVNKATPKVDTTPTVNTTYHPKTKLSDFKLDTAVNGVDGNTLPGSWKWATPNQTPQVYNSGYMATFTPDDQKNYETVDCTITVTVAKATPYIDADTLTAEEITYGQTLADSSVQGSVYYDSTKQTLVAGSFVWKNGSSKPTAKDDSNNTRYTVVFKPTDSDKYNEVETEITITVNKAQYAPNMPGSTKSVQNSITKVGDVTLPKDWVWQESDKDTPLEVDVAQRATALYEGADQGNYEKESVEIILTRSACDHVPGEILYTGTGEHAPDCVNDGLGHRECTKCHAVTESGIVVAALGHQGGTATCKKKAVCTVCHQEYGSTNPNNHAATEVRGHKNADCTSAGYTGDTYCADCGAKISSGTAVSALGHKYKSVETTAPTTTSTGVRTYTCERCGYSYTETIAKLPEEAHNHSYTGTVTRQADCTNAGVKTYTCSCGDSYTESIPALGHHYISKVTKQATTTAEGIMTYTCDRCGHSYTRPIAKLSGNGQQGNTDKPDNNNPGNDNKPADNNKPGDSNKPDDNTKPDTGKPYIEGHTEQSGWENIKDQLDDAKEKDTVTVEMNGTTVVPGDIFDTIKGKDVSVVFDMGDGIYWKVNGKDITEDKVGDIDFGVTVGTQAGNTIPVEIINKVTGERFYMNLTLAYDGEFGFKATLTLNVDKKNAGLYANLFYYNPETGKLEYICADQIDEDGNAELTFTHASDYTIVIDEGEMKETADTGNGEDNPSVPATSDNGLKAWKMAWILLIGSMVIVIGIGTFYITKRKKEE